MDLLLTQCPRWSVVYSNATNMSASPASMNLTRMLPPSGNDERSFVGGYEVDTVRIAKETSFIVVCMTISPHILHLVESLGESRPLGRAHYLYRCSNLQASRQGIG